MKKFLTYLAAMAVAIMAFAQNPSFDVSKISSIKTNVATPALDNHVIVQPVSSHPVLSKTADKVKATIPQHRIVPAQKQPKNRPIEGASMHPVKIQVLGQTEGKKVGSVCYFNASACDMVFPEEENGDVITVMLPEGKNDVVVKFYNLLIIDHIDGRPVWTNLGNGYYIIEDVEVGNETPMLTADLTECRTIPLELCIADGSPVEFPTCKWNGEEFEDISTGNLIGGVFQDTFYNSKYDCGICIAGVSYMGFEVEGYDKSAIEFWETKVNDASDNWVFSNVVSYIDSDYNAYNAGWLATPSTESVRITKDDFKPLDWNFHITPEAPLKGMGVNTGFFIDYLNGSMISLGQQIEYPVDNPKDIYFTNRDYRVNNTTPGWNLDISYSAFTEMIVNEEWGERSFYGIISPTFVVSEKNSEYVPSTPRFTSKPWESEEIGWQSYPELYWGVPEFNYSQKEAGMQFNYSAPYVVSYLRFAADRETGNINMYNPQNGIYGLAGEERFIDWNNEKWNIYFNGEPVNEPNSSIYDFIYSWNPSEKGEGILKMDVLLEPELTIDGIQAKNSRTITIHQGSEDFAPATLTCLEMRNDKETVTNVFEEASEGRILMSIADIHPCIKWEYWEDWDQWLSFNWDEARPGAELKVEVSPCGKNAWESLEAEGFGEFNPSLGDFYSVELQQVTAKSGNGWFDLRITTLDKTGNGVEQTITPAFKINSLTGVESFEAEKEVKNVKFFDMQGRALTNPQDGLYLRVTTFTDGTQKVEKQLK